MKVDWVMLVRLFFIVIFIIAVGRMVFGAGQSCDFNGDCGFSEYCHTVPFPQRGDNKSRGICVPNNTN